ncbi:MAG: bifunctional UDP-N-acetylmuramoyl-tripeptide:D-alanyl-D-alanine ligase/alanine racemase [Bacteroidetes bacterium]|nr:bifunctional UDP-N-acetylmuramoyl-tripeptide:D-alanyl-D-alanine ligase/alanine racemase [Bacteroidota bacterium]
MPNSVNYSFGSIVKILKNESVLVVNEELIVKNLLIDSRKLITPEFSIFFAIVTKRNDGHKFIEELYQKSVRNFVVSAMPENIDDYSEANFILVKDTLKSLQALSINHRKNFKIPVIGITGSNGKTIIKEWLYQLLCEDKKIVRSPKSFNSQIGVPLSVWQMDYEHELAIFEAGISETDEMDKIQPIIQPTIGIFTNIGQAHDENFINHNQKVGEKIKLFSKVNTLIFCLDHSEIKGMIFKSENFKNIKSFTWSKKFDADLNIKKITKNGQKTTISAIYKTDTIEIVIPFTDDASIENSIHCWCLMLLLGYSNASIAKRMLLLAKVAMRLELKEGINNCSIINDSYNSDLNSLIIAIDFLNQQKQHHKKSIILSDILQSGRDEDDLYKQVGDLLQQKGIDKIIGIGKAITRQKDKFNIEKIFYNTTSDFLSDYSFSEFHNETILLKGARLFKFEAIGKALQQKAHETVLEINLNALIHNLNYYKSLLNADTKIMAMVKAFSYGSGSYEIANILQYHQVDYLTVAYTDEGIELRKSGITSPIMVMNPEEQSFDTMIKYSLEPEIYSFRILNLFEESILRHAKPFENPLPIHIKLDTGMHRLGFDEKDLPELINRIKSNTNFFVKSIFSHLAGSDDPVHDDFTNEQIDCFKKMSDQVQEVVDYNILRHILNSSGISRFRDAQFEMVRLGIGLYGVGCNETEQSLLQNVSTLKTNISQIKTVEAGQTIGYSRNGKAEKEMQIATIPIGYADGLSRTLGNGKGKLFYKNNLVPIVGNVCMDMCMIDVTNLGAEEGEEVVIFGKEFPINQLAEVLGTIPYEVLTSVSRRVKRVYYQE